MKIIVILAVLAIIASIVMACLSYKMKDMTAKVISYIGLAVWIGIAIAGGIELAPVTWDPACRALAVVGISVVMFGAMYLVYLVVMFCCIGRFLIDAIFRIFTR